MDMNSLMVNEPKKAFNKLAPALIGFSVFEAIYNLIDLTWAAALGSDVVAAIGIGTPLFVLINIFGCTIGQGTNSLMSRLLGGGDVHNTKNAMMHGFLMCVIFSILLPLIEILFLNKILLFMNLQGNVELVKFYLIPLLVFSFIFIFTRYFPETLQVEGETRKPTIFLIMGNILNILLDPIFGLYFGLGIKGFAYATIISSLLPFGAFIYLYFVKKDYIPIKLSNFQFKTIFVKEIFKVFLPNLLDRSTFAILSIYVNLILASVGGPTAISIYALVNQFKELIISPSRGAARSALSISAHLLGADKTKDLKLFYNYSIKIGILLSAISSVILILFISIIIKSEIRHPNLFVVIWNVSLITVISLFIPIAFVSGKVLDGLGLSLYSFAGTFLNVLISIILVYSLEKTFHLHGLGVILGITISEVIIDIIYFVFLNLIFKYWLNKCRLKLNKLVE